MNNQIEKMQNEAEFASLNEQYIGGLESIRMNCMENGKEFLNRIILPHDFHSLPSHEKDQEIIKAIKFKYPQTIDNSIFHFPFNWHVILTDKNELFSLWKHKNNKLDKELKSEFSIKFEELKTMEHDNEQIISKWLKVKKFIDGLKEDNPDIEDSKLSQTVNSYCILIGYNEKDSNFIKDWNQKRESINSLVEQQENYKHQNPIFSLRRRTIGRQVDIYLSQKGSSTCSKLGYKVYEKESTQKIKEWDKIWGNWKTKEVKRTHYFIKMSEQVFINACKSKMVLPNGQTMDEQQNIIEVKRGRSKGCSNNHLSHRIGFRSELNGEQKWFDSMSMAAGEFGVNKGNFSRLIKGKTHGDTVSIKRAKYTILIDNEPNLK